MATTQDIGGNGTLFVGEDKNFELELLDIAGVPVDMAGMAFVLDVRKRDNSADPAIISKVPTLTGVYNSVRATNTQRQLVVLTDTELNLFKARTYRYSWKRTDDGSETVVVRGNFAPEKATAP